MIDSLNEINRLLIAINTLSLSNKGALKKVVIDFCRNQVIDGRFPNHEETISFCKKLGLIKQFEDRLKFTRLGKKVNSLNPDQRYELNGSQKHLLTKSFFLEENMKQTILEILKKFTPSYPLKTFTWSSVDSSPLDGKIQIFELLKQSGFLLIDTSTVYVNKKYVALARETLRKPQTLPPEELAKRLKKAEACGRVAEEIVLNFEKQRLKKMNCLPEAECIQKISELDANAGYDIASFDGENLELIPDRFIEVKGSVNTNVNFYWTRNEMDTARKLGSKYWIYFVGGVSTKQHTAMLPPITIQNPFKQLEKKSDFEIECVTCYVKKK